ncbi:barstar family protein [Clostridium vitabionis]|uniref:barstar family protein n=1 Tax=Clostridium vitabionis TaxID=2784388 RepID=UPI00188C6298|nr:barstar family protein [Clostridium vitabionis]
MERIDLDFNELKTEEEVYSLLAGQMHFPESFTNNLDALDKELAEGLTENYGLRVIPGGEDAPLADFQKRFLKVLEDDAETFCEQDGAVYAVFTDKSPKADPWNWFRDDLGGGTPDSL